MKLSCAQAGYIAIFEKKLPTKSLFFLNYFMIQNKKKNIIQKRENIVIHALKKVN